MPSPCSWHTRDGERCRMPCEVARSGVPAMDDYAVVINAG